MIIAYALIAAFMFGVYIGSAYEEGAGPGMKDVIPMVVWSTLWPFVLGLLCWIEIKRRSHKP